MSENPSSRGTAARGIDIGYFNVKYTLGRKQDGDSFPVAVDMFPSLAPRIANGDAMATPTAQRADGCPVDVDGVRYFVGREVTLNSTGVEPRPVSSDFALTPRYQALLKGALHYMLEDVPGCEDLVIRQLVLGLPMTSLLAHHRAVAACAKGEHVVGTGSGARRVTVHNAHVIPQPVGALINFGLSNALDGWSLVVDVGGGTLDWYVGTRKNMNIQRSGAHPKAMLACAEAVAQSEDATWLDQFEVMGRIDTAIREGRSSYRVQGQDVPLTPRHRRSIDAVLEESMEKMFSKVGHTGDIERVLVTGGGGSVFGEFLVRKRPDLAKIVVMDPSPVFSNVRGFQVYGEMMDSKSAGAHAGN